VTSKHPLLIFHITKVSDDYNDIQDGFTSPFPPQETSSLPSDVDDTTTQLPNIQTHPLLQIPCSIQLSSGGTLETDGPTVDTSTSPLFSSTSSSSSSILRMTALATFIDTGAQVSVISAAAASRAGILHMIDRRYAGRAQGIGQCRVLGRFPAGSLVLHLYGGVSMDAPAVTVLEHTHNGVDLLLGVDFLRERGAILNLRTEEMILQQRYGDDVAIPFLRPRGATLDLKGATLTDREIITDDDEDGDDDDEEVNLGEIDMSGV
jgi:Aspartyl protease